MRIELNIPAVPVAQPRQRSAMIAGRMTNYTPVQHPVNAFKAAVGLAWQQQGCRQLDGPLSLDVVFVMPRPQAMTWKTRPNPRCLHAKKPDLDNLLKALKDGLTACGAWRDDSQVACCHACKTYASGGERGEAGESPHVEVIIEELATVPAVTVTGRDSVGEG